MNAVILSAAKCLANYPNPKQSQSELTAAARKKEFQTLKPSANNFFFSQEVGRDWSGFHFLSCTTESINALRIPLDKIKEEKGRKNNSESKCIAMVFIVHVRI